MRNVFWFIINKLRKNVTLSRLPVGRKEGEIPYVYLLQPEDILVDKKVVDRYW